jgi:hypothetical protein
MCKKQKFVDTPPPQHGEATVLIASSSSQLWPTHATNPPLLLLLLRHKWMNVTTIPSVGDGISGDLHPCF